MDTVSKVVSIFFVECRKDCYPAHLRRAVQVIIIDMVGLPPTRRLPAC